MGILDVGSNTVHLLVVDAHPGAPPLAAHKDSTALRLVELRGKDGTVTEQGIEKLVECCRKAVKLAEDKGVAAMHAFATSALREAGNGQEIAERVRRETGLDLRLLSGEAEARFTFLAARRWYGWSTGRLLSFDIGGGSLELAVGLEEEPESAVSLPLGAARLTHDWFGEDPPEPEKFHDLRRYVRTEIADVVGSMVRGGAPDRVVASSKTFHLLAGVAAATYRGRTSRTLHREDLSDLTEKLAAMSSDERAQLPGVSSVRAKQLLAGAVVADAAMDLFSVTTLDVCPWALREGFILRQLDQVVPNSKTGSV